MEEYRIKQYFELDQKIKRLEILLEKTNKEMFQQTLATHLSYSDERGIHVKVPRIENIIIDNIMACELVEKRIERNRTRLKYFRTYLTTLGLKELQAKFKELDTQNERIEKLRAESNKLNDEINKLNEKMKVSPSFDLTQKIGTLTSGKQTFDESLRQHEKAFETTVNKSYSHLRESANRHINNSIENVKEIEEAKKNVKKALNTLLEENNKLDQLVNKHWDKATEEVYSTNIERYADMIGSDYIAPSVLMKPTGLTNHFINELEKEIRNQEG